VNFKIKHFVIPSWLIALLLISGVGTVVLAQYLSLSVIMPVEVKEPLEILNYTPSEISLFPGENESITVTVMNHAPVNYSLTLDFQLNDTRYQRNYAKFSDEIYVVLPGQRELTTWMMIEKNAPAAHLSLAVTILRSRQILSGALLFEDFEDGNLDAWIGDKTYKSCSDEQAHSGIYSCKVYVYNSGYAVYSMYRDFTATAKIEVDFYLYVIGMEGDLSNILAVADSNGLYALWIASKASTSALCYHNSVAWTEIQVINTGKWYHIKAELDSTTDTLDIWVDGILKISDGNFYAPTGALERFNIIAQKGTCDSRYYLDDLICTSH